MPICLVAADPVPEYQVTLNGYYNIPKNILVVTNFGAWVKNYGDETSIDTRIDITISGGLPFKDFSVAYSIGDIDPSSEKWVPTHGYKLYRVGNVEITIQVGADNADQVTTTFDCIALGFLYIVQK